MSGTRMAAEMSEQPAVLQALLERRDDITAQVRALVPSNPCGVTLVARGSSDHAAMYGRYLIEMAGGRPVALAAPSIHTLYGARVDHDGYVAIAVSQSGRTPEIISVLQRMREAGARTIAIGNDESSPLVAAADLFIALRCGPEQAVPATKTFTATLLAFAIIASALGSVAWSADALASLPLAVRETLRDRSAAEAAARRIVGADRVLVVGRGLLLGAAAEVALKLRETTGIFAESLSSADLRHGPIAGVAPDVPVVAITAPGPAAADVADMAGELRRRGNPVITVAPELGADLSLPPDLPEALQAVPAAVRGQQLALCTALQRHLDPDAPHGLTKVTLTR